MLVAVLLLLLGSIYGSGVAGAIVTLCRLSTILGDGLLFGIGILFARSRSISEFKERDLDFFESFSIDRK